MILYDLKCRKGHVFEAWFRDSGSYDDQVAAGGVACPSCGSKKVEKAVMAPRLAKRGLDRSSSWDGESQAGESQAGEPQAGEPQGGESQAGESQAGESHQAGAGTAGDMTAAGEAIRAMRELRRKVEENCTYVGGAFAEEARKIHYGETESKNIYGETSDAEAKELSEEGVSFNRIPWIPRHDS